MAIDHEEKLFIALTEEAIKVEELISQVTTTDSGAISTFIGITRDNFEGKKVIQLEYEAYKPMAEKKLQELGQQVFSQWPEVRKLAMVHRLGVVPVSEASVVIVAASPHRTEAIAATSWAIDELKAVVPIWKREVYQDGDRIWKENKECRHAHRHSSSHH